MKVEDLELVLDNIDIEDGTMETRDFEDGRFVYIEAVDNNLFADVTYLVYQCTGEYRFSFDDYNRIKEDIENSEGMNSFFKPIFVFDDLDQETIQYEEEYNRIKTAEDRRRIKDLFAEKKSVYKSTGKIILAIDEDGINFLEYGNANMHFGGADLNGYVYNVSYYELKKLFNISGKELFRENIRYGLLKENYTKKKLIKNFEKYLKVGIFNEIKYSDTTQEAIESNETIRGILELDEESVEQFVPNIFWFNHNGVTVFVMDEKIDRSNNTIEFSSQNASIINGAQTMTNLYKTTNAVKRELLQLCEKELKKIIEDRKRLNTTVREYIDELIDKICKTIYLKTIFIEGDKRYVKGISDGLNTQVPISEIDILAGSAIVEKLNGKLAKENIRIVKEGELENKNQISVLNFAKKYKIIQGIPGTSKNLNRNVVENIIKEASENGTVEDLARKIRMVMDADEWWIKNKKEGLVKIESEVEANIYKYGRNYYESYVILRMPDNTDEDVLSNIFIEFIRDAKLAKIEKTMAEFKKDDLFIEIQQIYKNPPINQLKEGERDDVINGKLNDLMKYLDEKKENNYNISALITRFWEGEKISFDYFRTITVRNQDGKYVPAESFPFPSNTFSELYLQIDYSNDTKIVPEFEKSSFCNEIKRKYPIFIIERQKDGKIVKVHYRKEFSFEKYEKDAQVVFDKTVKAFEDGNEEEFVKSSDNLGFHIRPKAANSNDTFEFSNGKEITKRTFWANKSIIKELLNENRG